MLETERTIAWATQRVADLTLQAWGLAAHELDSYWFRATGALCGLWRPGEVLRSAPAIKASDACDFCSERELNCERKRLCNVSTGAVATCCTTCLELVPEMARRIGEEVSLDAGDLE